jgi:hypothetical protein
MSSLTKCNYCVLEQIKASNPGKEVVVLKTGEKMISLQVYVQGKPIGVWFMALSDHCVCND